MSRVLRIFFFVSLIGAGFMIFSASASTLPAHCEEGTQESGAVYRICMPPEGRWNGDLVVYAHGYVAPNEPVGIPESQLFLPDGTSIPGIVNALGYAFATTSYSKNGLAVTEGIVDILDLVTIFKTKVPSSPPRHVYLVGASEGGLITTLALERFPHDFSGGLALCGPVGDFRRQVNYWGDFRVVFDYFFPGLLPPSPVDVPSQLIENWNDYERAIAQAVLLKPHATEQLLRVTKAPVDPGDSASILETVLGVLWYNAFATNDAVHELKGQPFSNRSRLYVGSDNDLRLNLKVQRFSADPDALAEIADHYQTSGRLTVPLVTLHTTADPIVPYWHEILYGGKVLARGSAFLYSHIPIPRYGHCNFKASEALAGFALVVLKVTGLEMFKAEEALPDIGAWEEFWDIIQEHGVTW